MLCRPSRWGFSLQFKIVIISLRGTQADGDTPLYDSLVVGRSMLERFKAQASSYQILLLTDLTDPMEKNPSAALRIICLTDGKI